MVERNGRESHNSRDQEVTSVPFVYEHVGKVTIAPRQGNNFAFFKKKKKEKKIQICCNRK